MATVSVLISSGGRKSLLYKALESVLTQEHTDFNVIVSVPQTKFSEMDQCLNRRFFKSGQKQKAWTLIAESLIGEGKNWALKNGPEGVLLFIDEDVSLPDKNYLKRLESYHEALSNIEILGGPYTSTPDCSLPGRAYNQVARIWMEKHRNPEVIGRYNDFLVAGNLSLKLNRKTRSILFSTSFGFGGEEEVFLNAHWKAGHSSRLIETLSLNHHAHHDLKTFYSRAWLHGSKSQKTLKLTTKDIQHILAHSGKGREKLMVYSYLACTRASSLYNHQLKNLQRLIPVS